MGQDRAETRSKTEKMKAPAVPAVRLNKIFNTLKNKGGYIEHNFGYGQHHLSMHFFVLNLPALLAMAQQE